jgi:hypothetical protein
MGVTSERQPGVRYELALPCDLSAAIEAKAISLGSDVQTTIATLLRFGLAVQEQREATLSALYDEALQNAHDEKGSDRLGEFIFGK